MNRVALEVHFNSPEPTASRVTTGEGSALGITTVSAAGRPVDYTFAFRIEQQGALRVLALRSTIQTQ